MLFNSPEYLLFFLVVLAGYWGLRRHASLRIWLLLIASYYFYASNNHWLIVLILASTQIDYVVAKAIERATDQAQRRRLLWVSLVGNLGMLAFFKYFNFFAASMAGALHLVGVEVQYRPWEILLPVGISFYTFQSMSYTLDVYYGYIRAEQSWSRFAFYVAFFPQLVAGPIMRAREFLPQITRPPTLDGETCEQALALIARGLLKKMVLADYFLGPHADLAFDTPGAVSTLAAWIGLYAFTFQIYFDFSGYTDIAIGCSRLLGFDLPDNFNLPYVAESFSDFWRRWHISLSTWLRDYLYIPLGGNRMPTRVGVYRNLMLTMLLGGLWHGAAWHFVIWGALHGTYLVVERYFLERAPTPPQRSAAGLALRRLLIFHAVVLTWLVFRAQDNTLLWELIRALCGGSTQALSLSGSQLMACVVIVASYVAQGVALRWDPMQAFARLPAPIRSLSYAGLVVLVLAYNVGAQPFIYFQF